MKRKDMWTDEQISFLMAHYKDMEYADIGQVIGRTKDAVNWKVQDLGLSNDNTWRQDEVDYLVENFDILSKSQIAKHLGRTPNGVQIKANRLGLKHPDKYTYNVDFFEDITTEEPAYWLGFIMADGWIHQSPTNAELGIELAIKDIEHLKKFNKSLSGNIAVNILHNDGHYIDGRYVEPHKSCIIRLYRKKIVEDLRKYGIHESKTYDLRWPNLPHNMIRHMIRGYFDGDGSVSLDRSKQRNIHRFNFTSACKPFLEKLREWLYQEYKINSYICLDKPNSITYKLCIGGMTNAYEFGQLLYKDANIYLDRKRKRYFDILEEYDIENRIKNSRNKKKESASCLSVE